MPVSVGNIPDITQRVHDSVDPINVTIGDIANTCKSNKSQSDEQAGDALDEAKKQNGPVMEVLSHLSQALTPITADMISLTDQVNAKLRPYEAEVTRAQQEQLQIAQSNNWYAGTIAGEEADIVAAQAAFDALDTESETYAADAEVFTDEITTSQNNIDVYNEELGILNGPYATDWEAHRAYHQAIVDDIISIFNRYMDPIKRKYTDVDNGVIRTINLTTSASNDLLDAASNIAKNIAKTADKASIELLKHVAAQTTVQKRSNSRDNDVKPTIKPVPRPEARAEPFVAKDGVLTYTRVRQPEGRARINAEDDIAANKYPNERLIRINKSSDDSGTPANEFNIDYIDGLYQSTFARPLTDYERDFWLRVIEDRSIFAKAGAGAVAPDIAKDRNPLRRILSYATSREPAWNLLKESTTPTLFETQVEKDWENYVIYTYRTFFGRAPTRDELIEARAERLLLEQTAKDQIGESGTAGQRTEFVWSDWQGGVRNAQAEVNLQPLINSVFRNLFSRDTTTVELQYWQNQIIEKGVYLPYERVSGLDNIPTEVEYNDPEYFENIVLTDYMQDAYVPIDLDDGDVNNDQDHVLTAQAEEDLTVYIGNLYQKYFSRGPDSGGLASWLEDVRLSEDPAGLRIRMINGSQGTDRDAYISYLYNKLFQRNPSPQGIAHWNKQIADPNANPPTRSKLQAALLAAAQNSGDKEKADEYIQSLSVESSIDTAFVSFTKGGLDEIFLRLFDRRASEEEFIYWSGGAAVGTDLANSIGSRYEIERIIIRYAREKALNPDNDQPGKKFFSVADWRYYLSKYNELSLDTLKDGELIVVEGTKWLPVLEWENQWFEKTGELIDLETRYDVINFKKGERQDPAPTTSDDFPEGTKPRGTYTEPPKAAITKDKLKRYNRFTGTTLLQGRYTVGSIGNPTTDKIAGQLAHEVRFQDNTNKVWKPGLPDIEVAAKNATQATAGMGGFDKVKIYKKKRAQEILTVYKTGVENAEAALEYNKFDSGKIVSDLTSPVTESKANSARYSLVSARRICKRVHNRLLDILVPNVPGLLRLIRRREKPIDPRPSPDICAGQRITGGYS